ncbi:TBC1 domain family member 12-like [Mercenaria mercenaria]|uniref:TBC1 domain family member 12-like n=1 Tax=Mercenaria mercenaria TaxID=6596 RepID=UPI001E1D4799|nr:TBC1 domain family member 12-like [Mercenaria mercenaria]
MRSKMSGYISSEGMSRVGNIENEEEIVTVSIFNNNDDVDSLKARLKEISAQDVENVEEGNSYLLSETRQDTECNGSSSLSHQEAEVHYMSDNSVEQTDSLCLSTETLIDSADSTSRHLPKEQNEESGLKAEFQKPRHLFESHSDSVIAHSNNMVTMSTTKVTSGLLISPTSLTQDVHVTMKDEKQRMSAVLDSLDLHLVYIPTTQQLVATKKTDTQTAISDSAESSRNGKIDESETESSGYKSNDTSGIVRSNSSPVKMSDSSSVHSIQFLSPGNLDDNSSVNETECLIRIRDPDGNSCDNSDFVCNFPRTCTNDSLLRTFTDASSLSSLSTGTDFSISAASLDDGEGTGHCIDTGDGGFMEINLHSRNSFERGKNPSQDSGFEDKYSKPKRKGISGFLSRGIFSRKSKDGSDSEDQGWKLFGKIPPKHVSSKNPDQIQNEYKAKHREEQQATNRSKKEDIEVMSTTALILENRPMNLPSKDREELERHQKEYEAMVEAAKRKEQKELKQKKKLMQQQLRQEEQLMAAARVWNKEILPNWDSVKNSKKVRDLWWHGIPTNVRGKVWRLALGNDLNITPELYEICVSRAADKIKQMDESPVIYGPTEICSEPPSSKESSVELIKLDVSRTFPQLCIFQKGGPYHDLLHSLLGAYACYRPDIGYVQGMSFIAAVLLLNMDVADAFMCFANLLNRPCQVAFFRVDEGLMKAYFQTYEEFFVENMPVLCHHFKKNNLTPDLYLYDWIFTLFTKSLPLDIACRVWDIFCRDGEEFLFRTALGILKCHEDLLMQMDFILLAQFLTKIPERDSYDALFRCIESIQMTIDKKKYSQVLASVRDSRDNT